MAKKFDPDHDGERDGLIGGEMTTPGSCEPCYDNEPADGCVEVGDMLSGDAFSYLGHFRKPSNARRGHNCWGSM